MGATPQKNISWIWHDLLSHRWVIFNTFFAEVEESDNTSCNSVLFSLLVLWDFCLATVGCCVALVVPCTCLKTGFYSTLWWKFRAKSLTSISTNILQLFNSCGLLGAAFVSRFGWDSNHHWTVLDSFGLGSKASPNRVQIQNSYATLAFPMFFVFVLDSFGLALDSVQSAFTI